MKQQHGSTSRRAGHMYGMYDTHVARPPRHLIRHTCSLHTRFRTQGFTENIITYAEGVKVSPLSRKASPPRTQTPCCWRYSLAARPAAHSSAARTLPSACPASKAAAIASPQLGMAYGSCVQELNNQVMGENRAQPIIQSHYYFTSVRVRLGEGIQSRTG